MGRPLHAEAALQSFLESHPQHVVPPPFLGSYAVELVVLVVDVVVPLEVIATVHSVGEVK